VAEAVKRARKGFGPSIIENETYRYKGHFEGDRQRYRSPDEIQEYRLTRDPIDLFEAQLLEDKVATQKEIDAIKTAVAEEIEDAVRFAEESPLPDPHEAMQGLFVNP
jgi:TPP-dependent pyruvate/acetoin dehydrogenase alpha subunit